ncbi:hypothetical protein R6Q59_003764 [Mikania micrantha]
MVLWACVCRLTGEVYTPVYEWLVDQIMDILRKNLNFTVNRKRVIQLQSQPVIPFSGHTDVDNTATDLSIASTPWRLTGRSIKYNRITLYVPSPPLFASPRDQELSWDYT